MNNVGECQKSVEPGRGREGGVELNGGQQAEGFQGSRSREKPSHESPDSIGQGVEEGASLVALGLQLVCTSVGQKGRVRSGRRRNNSRVL